MSFLTVTIDPGRETLRRFGLIGLVAFGLVGAWIRWRHTFLFLGMTAERASSVATVLWVAAAACGILAIVAPLALRVLYVGMTLVAIPVGFVISHVVVWLLFFAVLLPVALLHRAWGGDPLSQRDGRAAGWREKGPPPDPAWYYRQF
jgi:hypothetical protein